MNRSGAPTAHKRPAAHASRPLGPRNERGASSVRRCWTALLLRKAALPPAAYRHSTEGATWGLTGRRLRSTSTARNLGPDYTPGLDRPSDERAAGNWDGRLNCVKQWLEYLKREWQAPDLWAELLAQRRLVTAIPSDTSNEPFNPEEQKEISRQLTEIKTYVRRTYQLSESQYEAIDARLDYFADAAKRLGRIDWRNAFIGAFLGAVLQAVLPPKPVQDIINSALRGASHAFGVDIPELPR